MMPVKDLLVSLVLVLLLVPRIAGAQFVEIPPLTGPVVDTTGVLGPAATELEQQLWQLKNEKGSEVGVLVVSTTKPETIEQYSIRVVEQWKLGRQGVDDGVLLLVALGDRTVRIEVGRGLEGDIPDVKAHRIIDEQIVPKFRGGDIPGGIRAGVDSIVALVRGGELPPPQNTIDIGYSAVPHIVFFGFVIGSFITLALGRAIGAISAAGVAYLVSSVLMSMTAGIVSAIAAAVVTFLFSHHIKNARSTSGRRGSWSSGSSSSSYGGGSFGGGGSFSGGGSSGRW